MNSCHFIGRATKDVEVRASQDGKSFARFSLAVDTGWGENKKASFFNIIAFGKTAESLEKYVKKGVKLAIRCEAQQDNYTDKDGITHRSVNFVLRDWEFCESKKSQENTQEAPVGNAPTDFMDIPDDLDAELPFN